LALACVLVTLVSGAGAAVALSVRSGESYWLVSSSGQVFAFGKAHNYGSEAGKRFRGEIVGIVGTPDGNGYWLVSSVGHRFPFGDAQLYRYKGAKFQKLTGHVALPRLRGRLRGRIVGVAIAKLAVGKPATVTTTSNPTPVKTPTPVTTVTTVATTTTNTPTATVPAGPAPLTIVTTTVPYPVETLPYSTTLAASGGDPPYTWAWAPADGSTLPGGLTLSGDGVLSGTASTPGSYTFTVTLTDAAGATTQLTYLMMVANPTDSYNWSGYVEQTTAAFTSASGTFTVPTLDSGDDPSSALAEWVGVDGDSGTDTNLIQAGVENNPPNGTSPTGETYAWWEVLPANETPIPEPVQPGDQVSVTITKLGTACSSSDSDPVVAGGVEWDVTITDATENWNYPVTLCYAGPGSSAEWIVEAPEEQSTYHGQTEDDIVPLAGFSPDVSFTNLTTSTTASALNHMTMVQPPATPICVDTTAPGGCSPPTNLVQKATPSGLDSTGFNVAYGPDAPAAP
jgi:hypothetical protein